MGTAAFNYKTMTDIYSKEKRSKIMKAVRNKDSKLEVDFRRTLWNEGFRYRKNVIEYFGKPDLVLKKYRTVIFIDSCFWHGCKKHCKLPATRNKWWAEKIKNNKKRDKEVNRHYKKMKWRVIRLWEHDLKRQDFHFDFKQIKQPIM